MEHEIVESLFAIVKNGQVPAMQLVLGGDVALSCCLGEHYQFPALSALTRCAFHGEYLSLRFNYYDNSSEIVDLTILPSSAQVVGGTK